MMQRSRLPCRRVGTRSWSCGHAVYPSLAERLYCLLDRVEMQNFLWEGCNFDLTSLEAKSKFRAYTSPSHAWASNMCELLATALTSRTCQNSILGHSACRNSSTNLGTASSAFRGRIVRQGTFMSAYFDRALLRSTWDDFIVRWDGGRIFFALWLYKRWRHRLLH